MYEYTTERPYVMTDEGQRKLIKMRDRAMDLCAKAGVVRAQELMAGFSGNSWETMSCVDRLVEIGDLREIHYEHGAWQFRVFERPGH